MGVKTVTGCVIAPMWSRFTPRVRLRTQVKVVNLAGPIFPYQDGVSRAQSARSSSRSCGGHPNGSPCRSLEKGIGGSHGRRGASPCSIPGRRSPPLDGPAHGSPHNRPRPAGGRPGQPRRRGVSRRVACPDHLRGGLRGQQCRRHRRRYGPGRCHGPRRHYPRGHRHHPQRRHRPTGCRTRRTTGRHGLLRPRCPAPLPSAGQPPPPRRPRPVGRLLCCG